MAQSCFRWMQFFVLAATGLFPLKLFAGWEPSECKEWASTPDAPGVSPKKCVRALEKVYEGNRKIVQKSWTQESSAETVVETFGGSTGERGTSDFTLEGEWKIRWTSHGDAFHLTLYNSDNNEETKLADLSEPGSGVKKFKEGGTFYLETATQGAWSIEVIDISPKHSYSAEAKVTATLENPFDFPIKLKASFASTTETFELDANEYAELEHTFTLTDFEEKVSDEDLLHEVEKPHILKIQSNTEEAIAARQSAHESGGRRTTDQAGFDREAAESELEEFAETADRYSDSDRDEVHQKLESRRRSEAVRARDARRGLIAGAVISMVGGIGGGVGLIVAGKLKEKDAQKELDDFQATLPDTEKRTIAQNNEESRLQNKVGDAKPMITGGGILIGVGVIAPTVMFILARKMKIKHERLSIAPSVGPRFSGLQLQLRF